MPSTSIFADLIEWFLGRAGERRQYKRRPGAFHMWWQKDAETRVQGVGMEISPNGLVFIMEPPIAHDEFNIVCRIRDRMIPIRVRRVRFDRVDHKGGKWYRYMCSFSGVAADNWDFIVNYVNDVPEAQERPKLQSASEDKDDAYRLLPLAIQEKILAILVDQSKLAPPRPGQSPLVKLYYGGVQKVGETMLHRFNVHSRVKVDETLMAYDTRFLVDEQGEVKVQK